MPVGVPAVPTRSFVYLLTFVVFLSVCIVTSTSREMKNRLHLLNWLTCPGVVTTATFPQYRMGVPLMGSRTLGRFLDNGVMSRFPLTGLSTRYIVQVLSGERSPPFLLYSDWRLAVLPKVPRNVSRPTEPISACV